ncbi:MAG TPA: 4-alpha-glucanotransferase [Candidatus Methylomirabilis sp.]|nr:4-alpha-glucanotransferase [Candidatus Methylomirabilis sp.]
MTASRGTRGPALRHLARLYGLQTAYHDVVADRRREASPEALLAVLRALGAPVGDLRDVPGALREGYEARWQRLCEPVLVAWDGGPVRVRLRLPAGLADGTAACELQQETGEVRRWTCDLSSLPSADGVEVEGRRYVSRRLLLPPGGLPWGYHRLRLEIADRRVESLLIAAPLRAFGALDGEAGRSWGVFLPLYALHSARSWGAGDLADLEALATWVAELGGELVGTLPLLPAFLDEPYDPSPYAPASRLFWNELYLDVTRTPDLERSPAAQALLASPAVQAELTALRGMPLVDPRRAMALKRRILEALARTFFSGDGDWQRAFRRFAEGHQALEDYARFRAAGERRGAPWPDWPLPQRDGLLTPGDYDEEARRYHLYVQWLAHDQLRHLAEAGQARGVGVQLDLPLGVHPASYDVWRERALFVPEMSGGAPPDGFFIKGQNWGCPPLHPERIRTQGYRYPIACLRHHLALARVLRIDHLMGLHRLFWIPPGMPVEEGVYVRYRAEELYAILTLESCRHRTLLVGEDLGTVPPSVRPAMARHHIQRTYVLPFEMAPDPQAALCAPSDTFLASLNTHDMRPFAGFWQGLDIRDRVELGLLAEAQAREERRGREALKEALVAYLQRTGRLPKGRVEPADVLRACLAFLAASAARIVLVNLEDLWLEAEPQNTPGTRDERPNWRRRARYPLEAIRQMPQVLEALCAVDRGRKEVLTPR